MALTAAHCVSKKWANPNRIPSWASVTLNKSTAGRRVTIGIKEIRVNDCWNFNNIWSTISNDLAIIVLDRDKPDAVEGVDYISPWYGSESDLIGKTFMLTGWGRAGEES